MIRPKVLFLCTANSTRTQMAEGFLRDLAGDRFEVFSAGGTPEPVSPAAIQAMREAGVDISSQSSKDVKQYFGQRFTYVIHLCDREVERECPIFPGAVYRLKWDFDDPRKAPGAVVDTTRQVRDEIRRHVLDFIQQHG